MSFTTIHLSKMFAFFRIAEKPAVEKERNMNGKTKRLKCLWNCFVSQRFWDANICGNMEICI